MRNVALKCSCGAVQGTAYDVNPSSGNRIVCYCDDCQTFAQQLRADNSILDEHGGTDIFQMPPYKIQFESGTDQLRCLKLKADGMYRWYTACCKTPIGNTMAAKLPFVGLIHNIMDDAHSRDQNLGDIRAHVQTKFAKPSLPAQLKQSGFPTGLMLRTVIKMLAWKLNGKRKQTPFFDPNGKPIIEATIVQAND